MRKVVMAGAKPVKLWLDDIEDGALQQAINLANLPFTFKHVSIMPDSHQGYGMPIGAVLATENVIIPNAVGVDIGCGMCALRTPIRDLNTEQLKEILTLARRIIPVGFNKHQIMQSEEDMPYTDKDLEIVDKNYDNARKQLGTLGGGNHFIEIQKGDDGYIWIMIHSGSRNLGYKVAKHYNELAQELNEAYCSVVDKSIEMAFLPYHSEEGKRYMEEMEYCVEFAYANRAKMMRRIANCIETVVGEPIDIGRMINESHNFVAMENHFGKNVLVHRKGATRAYKGMIGMIPSSQGAKSYIVAGKGEEQSFKSCSHGAGRKMGRKQAVKELNLEEEVKALEDKGILHSIRGQKDLDEAPSSYKDIDVVMANQTDLVDVLVELTPLAVIKG